MPDYQVKFATHAIGRVDIQIRSLLDKQQYADPAGVAERLGISSATWPLFGVVWPAGLILAEIMSRFPIAGKRILEVGCGIAVASIVIHQQGGDITASDIHPLAGPFLVKNIALNHFPPIKFQSGNWLTENPLLGKFDLIIGSDVLYEPAHPDLLSRFIARHSSDEVEVIIVDPGRGHHGRFTREMAALGYAHSSAKPGAQATKGAPFKGRVLNYQRKLGG